MKLRLSAFLPVCVLAAGLSVTYFNSEPEPPPPRERAWQIQKQILASEPHLALPLDEGSAAVDDLPFCEPPNLSYDIPAKLNE